MCLVVLSCAIKGNFKGLFSYFDSTKNDIPANFILFDTLISYKTKDYSSPKICIINGSELLKVLKKYENSIVYIWKPNCKSYTCIPIEVMENISLKKNYNLFVVSEYYDTNAMNLLYGTRNIIFAINTKYYNSNFTKVYLNKFFLDLKTNCAINHQFLLFNRDVFKESYSSIEEIKY